MRVAEVRLIEARSGADHTERMRDWATAAVERLAAADLDGYVLKRSSPSCGVEGVRVHDETGSPAGFGRGLFAQALLERLPLLAVEEEERLRDERLRERFLERAFGHARVRELLAGDWTSGDLVDFHAAEKMLLRAHDPALARELGRLVAGASGLERDQVAAHYAELHARTLRKETTPGRHQDVLEHLAGHIEDDVSRADRGELQEAIESCRAGAVSLAVPVTLLRRHLRAAGAHWAADQLYLQAH